MAIQYHTQLDRVFHALGDGTRREMIARLAQDGAATASELGRPFDVAQPTISKHIKVLEKAGIVRRKVSGRVHRFALEDEALRGAEDWVAAHRRFWEGTLVQLEAFVAAPGSEESET